jgi:non-specific serine/threonine protein kinase
MSVTAVVTAAGAACTGDEPDRRVPAPRLSAAGLAWRALAPAPSERTEVAAAAVGDRIHVVGGYTGDGATVASVEIFDAPGVVAGAPSGPPGGAWSRGPDLPVAVNHAMAVSTFDAVYVFGGYLAGGDPSGAAFRLDGDRWRVLAPMPEGRTAGTALALGDTVYLAGGIGPGGLAERMLVYHVEADRWTTAAGPPTAREHLGGAAFAGRIYTVGGRTRADGNLAAFEEYDPATDRWERLPDLPTPRGGLAATAVCTGHVVAVGGEAEATFPEAEVYDLRSGSWSALPGLPTPRHGLGVVALGTTVYTLSGGPRPGLHVAGTTEAIDLSGLARPWGECPSP